MDTMWLQAEAMLAKAKGLPLPAKFVEARGRARSDGACIRWRHRRVW